MAGRLFNTDEVLDLLGHNDHYRERERERERLGFFVQLYIEEGLTIVPLRASNCSIFHPQQLNH